MNAARQLSRAYHFFHHRLQCTGIQVLHSPFVYRLYTECILKDEKLQAFQAIESRRELLLKNQDMISYNDPGAGHSSSLSSPIAIGRSISQIARHSLKPARQARLLHRLVSYFKPQYLLEMGTSLGITTSYLAMASGKTILTSMEGVTTIAERATENFKALKLDQKVRQQTGNFDELLPSYLENIPQVDMVFIDGNHQYQPTLRYFEMMLDKVHHDSVLIFDDIYWSEEMRKAWKEIQSHPKVRVSIDLYWMGLVFFRTGQAEEHFKLTF